jgi:hypothetical protein
MELCKFGLEGLCSCIYGDYHSYIPAKAPRCRRGPFYPAQKYFERPKWWLKSEEEASGADLCDCDVFSTNCTGRIRDPANPRCWFRITSSATDWHCTPKEDPPQNEGPHFRL